MGLGQDTEFFLVDAAGKSIPAHTYFGTKKEEDAKPRDGWLGYSFFRDGYALEFNGPPAYCRATLFEGLRLGVSVAKTRLPKNVFLTTAPVVKVDLAGINEWPEDTKQFGCSPTLDAYRGEQKEIDVNPLTLPFRTCGAHLHISSNMIEIIKKDKAKVQQFIKLCDWYLGLTATFFFHDDLEFTRRELYGQAGEFRIQPHGLEYRVCSSRILNHGAMYSLFSGVMRDVILGQFDKLSATWNPAWEEPLKAAINKGEGIDELTSVMLSTIPDPEGTGGIPHDFHAGYPVNPATGFRYVKGTKQDDPKSYAGYYWPASTKYDPVRRLDMATMIKMREIVSKIKDTEASVFFPTPNGGSSWGTYPAPGIPMGREAFHFQNYYKKYMMEGRMENHTGWSTFMTALNAE